MALVLAKCTQCGANLKIDDTKETSVCQFCGSTFILKQQSNINYNNDSGEIDNDESIDSMLKKVELLEKSNNTEKVIEVLEEIIEKFPDDYRGWFLLYKKNTEYYYLLETAIHNAPEEKKDELKLLLQNNKQYRDKENKRKSFFEFVNNYQNFDHYYFFLGKRIYAFECNNGKLFLVRSGDYSHVNRDVVIPKIINNDSVPYVNFIYERNNKEVNYLYYKKRMFGCTDDGEPLYNEVQEPLKFDFSDYMDIIEGKHQENRGYDKSLSSDKSYKRKREELCGCKKEKGCYIASCVYGSYDCPPVWTLLLLTGDFVHNQSEVFVQKLPVLMPALMKYRHVFYKNSPSSTSCTA